jgi:hyaluronan synthase
LRRAKLSNGRVIFVCILILAAVVGWGIRHVYHLAHHEATTGSLAVVWLVSFASIAWTNLLAVLERPRKATKEQQLELDKLRVVVLIPAYNEDDALLIACIRSLLQQSRLPDHIEVVDDGSTANYKEVRQWIAAMLERRDFSIRWTRTDNGGKRHAQAVGIRNNPDADIYLTLDSDTILDPEAIRTGLFPFADPKVQSVAGICLPLNVSDNLLTRFTGLWETIWQLVERSAQSTMNSVTVNSGILAFYRGDTIRPHIDAYLNETFFGSRVKFSDDSLMTLYAKMQGKTVQQPTSIAFSAVPNKYSHHIRRYMRWMRGSFIRSFWRFKYLPVNSYIYWLHLFRWIQFGIGLAVLVYLLWSGILLHKEMLPWLIGIPVIMSYIQSLRYFIIWRSDESTISQFLTFLTAPVAMLWQMTVLRLVKYYAYCTVFKTGWGTRAKVEVGING